jgi:hypothetical protein
MSYAGIPSVSDTDYYLAPKRDVRHGMLSGLGAVLRSEQLFCGVKAPVTLAEKIVSREAMRKMLARVGVQTYPGRAWQPSEQAAWNAFNKSKGLKPMLFGKYPQGTQCQALVNAANVASFPSESGVAGFRGFGDDAAPTSPAPTVLTEQDIADIKEAADELGIPNPLDVGAAGEAAGAAVAAEDAKRSGMTLAIVAVAGLGIVYFCSKSGGKSGKKSRR